MSPSGKAKDFDSFIRGFESRHPSQKIAGASRCYSVCFHAPVAQSAEHLPFKQGVRGSNPRWSTKTPERGCVREFCFLLSDISPPLPPDCAERGLFARFIRLVR